MAFSKSKPCHIHLVTYNTWHALDPYHPYLMLPLQSPWKLITRYMGQEKALARLAAKYSQDLLVLHLQELNPLPFRLKRLMRQMRLGGAGSIGNAGIRYGWLGYPVFLYEGLATLFSKTLKKRRAKSHLLSGWGKEFNFLGRHRLFFQLAEKRKVQGICGEYRGIKTAFFNLHLHNGYVNERDQVRRSQEIEKLVHFLNQQKSNRDLVFVSGDFNCDAGSAELLPLLDAEFLNVATIGDSLVLPLETWDPERNAFISDFLGRAPNEAQRTWDSEAHGFDQIYVWLSPEFRARYRYDVKLARVFDGPIPLSDHYGLQCDFSCELKRP